MRIVILSLVTLCFVLTSCQGAPIYLTPSPAPVSKKPEVERPLLLSEDRALLIVQEYLLSKATTARAKAYLTDLYASGSKWSAKTELLKDGTRFYNVMLETDDKAGDTIKPQWRQASWMVFEDRKVLPSPKFNANALRIETDLQELSSGK